MGDNLDKLSELTVLSPDGVVAERRATMSEETLKKPIWISLDDLADIFTEKLYELDSDEVDCMVFTDTDELLAAIPDQYTAESA